MQEKTHAVGRNEFRKFENASNLRVVEKIVLLKFGGKAREIEF